MTPFWLVPLLLACSAGAPEVAPAAGVELRRVLPGEDLDRPVHLAAVPDGSGRLVVVEQAGRIKLFRADADAAEGALLDIRSNVRRWGNEEGLLSVAFHPRFAATRTFFVFYSASFPRRVVVARFHWPAGSDVAALDSETVILEVEQPYGNHNGGQLAFGPDGFLYIGLGDGGSAGDPQGHGQDRTTLLGAILRIDVDGADAGRAYRIPPDNPFAPGAGGARPEIWAFGLRNPWRFSFDAVTGGLYAADVGQNAIEEVNRIVRGGNYGWNIMEGSACYRPSSGCPTAGLAAPIAEYPHGEGRSITGGLVYRGRNVTALTGRYLFGDFVSGTIWSIPIGGAGLRARTVVAKTSLSISSFGEDADGEAYVVDLQGGIYRLDVP